jgi:hypothetical protein
MFNLFKEEPLRPKPWLNKIIAHFDSPAPKNCLILNPDGQFFWLLTSPENFSVEYRFEEEESILSTKPELALTSPLGGESQTSPILLLGPKITGSYQDLVKLSLEKLMPLTDFLENLKKTLAPFAWIDEEKLAFCLPSQGKNHSVFYYFNNNQFEISRPWHRYLNVEVINSLFQNYFHCFLCGSISTREGKIQIESGINFPADLNQILKLVENFRRQPFSSQNAYFFEEIQKLVDVYLSFEP